MSPKSLTSRHSMDSCLFQLHSWKPFSNPKTLDPDPNPNPNSAGLHSKRPCLSDRATSLFSLSIDSIDFSKLSLFDDGGGGGGARNHQPQQSRRDKLRWSMAKKRRRKGGSRSVSGRSSDRSGTRNGRCCSVGANATATCSDFMVANGGTDSSGELFGNNVNGWASDVSEARRENGVSNGTNANVCGEMGVGFGFGFDGPGSESGYGSEPGYRGDAEFGYGDELDDDDDEGARLLLMWGQALEAGDSNMEMVGENTFSEQKTHHRGRRKKHEWRMVDSVR